MEEPKSMIRIKPICLLLIWNISAGECMQGCSLPDSRTLIFMQQINIRVVQTISGKIESINIGWDFVYMNRRA